MRHLPTFALLILFCASTAYADVCVQEINLAPGPGSPLNSVANGWLQWLNRGYTFSCTGSSTHLACSHGAELYSFDYICDSAHCYVEAYEGTTHWRNEAVMSTGNVWTWVWDAGAKNGRVVDLWGVCWPSACSGNHYGTCD
jgi:hypothetical protein